MKRYKPFKEDEIEGGLADNLDCQQIADKHNVSIDDIMSQLDKGVKVEMEHTDDEELAKEIAKDHLTEYPYYYDELDKMEKKFENKRGIKRMKRYEPKFKVKEADDNEAKTLEAVKALIDMKDISNEDEQGKFIELLKGIVFADNKHGDEFLSKINDFTSGLKIEDFKESCKKKPKKKDMKEAHVTIMSLNDGAQAISQVIQQIVDSYTDLDNIKFIKALGFGITTGIQECLNGPDYEDLDLQQKDKLKNKIYTLLFRDIKSRF